MNNNTPKTVDYYKKRYDIIVVGSLIIFFYEVIYYFSLNYFNNSFKGTYQILSSWAWLGKYWIIVSLIFLVIILVSSLVGSTEKFNFGPFGPYNISPKISLSALVVATIFYILLLSFPIFFSGGAQSSVFGSMIITMAGLIVIITRSLVLRFSFAFLILSIHVFLAFFYFIPEKKLDFMTEKIDYYFGIFLILIITAILSWKSKTIFEEETSSSKKAIEK